MYLQTIEEIKKPPGKDFMENVLDFISSIIGHVVTFIGGAAGLKLLDHFLRKKQDKISDLQFNISQLAAVHKSMSEVINKTKCDRFLILKGSNGGGVPKPGSPFFVSIVHGIDTVSDINESLIKYHKIIVDLHYLNMLNDILANKEVSILTREMPAGLLKRIYEAEGVTFSKVFVIAKTKSELIFGSIATRIEEEDFTGSHESLIIDLEIERIRQVFGRYAKGVVL